MEYHLVSNVSLYIGTPFFLVEMSMLCSRTLRGLGLFWLRLEEIKVINMFVYVYVDKQTECKKTLPNAFFVPARK